MQLELRFFATFREAVGQKTLEYEMAGDATIFDLLDELESKYDGLAGNLLTDGELAPQINVLKNGREVLHMSGTETELDEGDTVAIFPPVAGGSDGVDVDTDPDGDGDTDEDEDADADSGSTGPGAELTAEDVSPPVTRSYRGISRRLAAHYLGNLDGELVGTGDPAEATTVEGDGWTAELSAESVSVGGSLSLTEVSVTFTGDDEVLADLIERFSFKAMRAGG